MASGGGGGYGGRGGMGGGEPQEQASPYSYEGPDHSKASDSVSVANQLAKLYGRNGGASAPQADLSNPNELANAIRTEQENVGGMQSLISQAKGKGKDLSGSNLTSDMTPVTDEAGKQANKLNSEYNTWMNSGSTIPPKEWPQEMRERGAAEKAKLKDNTAGQQKKEMDTYYNKLYSSNEFKNAGENKKKMEDEYSKYIKWALETKRRPNLPSFFDMFGISVE